MILSARNNQFKFDFPRNFIPEPIAKKYKPFLTRIPGGLIKEPIDYWNYGNYWLMHNYKNKYI